jgi:aspartate kinase
VEYARRHNVDLRVRSTFSTDPGTIVYSTKPAGVTVEEPIVSGVAADKGQAKITVIGIPDEPGKAAELFKVVAEADANIDMIVQNNPTGSDVTDRVADISFTLPLGDLGRVAGAIDAAKSTIGFRELEQDADIGKLSVVGAGMISTSEIRISVVTSSKQLDAAARAVHTAFGLDSDTEAVVYAGTGR